jgi:hypothetical protein
MKSDNEILDSLIAGGLIGAALGALLSKNKEEGSVLGAMAGAAILATYKANEKASAMKIPMYVEENGNLFQIQPDGSKHFIRKLEKPGIKLNEHFKLK